MSQSFPFREVILDEVRTGTVGQTILRFVFMSGFKCPVDHNGPKALWFWGSGIPTGFIWVILLFWASATEVTWWHSTGEWAGLEDLRQPHAHVVPQRGRLEG